MSESSPTAGADLNKFQVRILAVLAGQQQDPPKGQAVKDELLEYYEEVNRGRLYPNPTELSEMGYVEIGQKDKRTNAYHLTDEGREVLEAELEWLQDQLHS